MPRGKAHAPEVRANAEGLLMAGHTQAEVCGLTGLDPSVIYRWATALGDRLPKLATPVASKKVESDSDLIMGYFRAALRAMISQAEVFGDPEYCRTQRANELAIAHGVIGDKLAGIATTAQALGLLGDQAAEAALPSPSADD
jgi:hypothetical protein